MSLDVSNLIQNSLSFNLYPIFDIFVKGIIVITGLFLIGILAKHILTRNKY